MLELDRDGVAALFIEVVARAASHRDFAGAGDRLGSPGTRRPGGTVLAIHGDYRVMALGEFRIGLNEVAGGTVSRARDPRCFPQAHGWAWRATAHAGRAGRSGDGTARRPGGRALRGLAGGGAGAGSGARVLRPAARSHVAHARAGAPRPARVVRQSGARADERARVRQSRSREMWFVPATQELWHVRQKFAEAVEVTIRLVASKSGTVPIIATATH